MGDVSAGSIAHFVFLSIQCALRAAGIETSHASIENKSVNGYNAAADAPFAANVGIGFIV
jgi:hypothetical protein